MRTLLARAKGSRRTKKKNRGPPHPQIDLIPGGGVLPYKRLCAVGWVRIFTNGLTIGGVAFSIELLEWGRTFSQADFRGKRVLQIYS